jgi:hypothetical protein
VFVPITNVIKCEPEPRRHNAFRLVYVAQDGTAFKVDCYACLLSLMELLMCAMKESLYEAADEATASKYCVVHHEVLLFAGVPTSFRCNSCSHVLVVDLLDNLSLLLKESVSDRRDAHVARYLSAHHTTTTSIDED